MPNYNRLYTPYDTALVLIDFQPQMLFGVANADRATLINNATLLAKVAKEFGVPTVITSVETEGFSGYVIPQLLDVFPGQEVIERSSMNSWDDAGFRKAIEATKRKRILLTGLWTEVCIAWPAIDMLGAGYDVFVVEDCCGATSQAAHDAALSRMVQAGATPPGCTAAMRFGSAATRCGAAPCSTLTLVTLPSASMETRSTTSASTPWARRTSG